MPTNMLFGIDKLSLAIGEGHEARRGSLARRSQRVPSAETWHP